MDKRISSATYPAMFTSAVQLYSIHLQTGNGTTMYNVQCTMVGEVSDLVTGTDEGRGSNIQLQNALVSTNTDWMNYGGKH